MSSYSTIIKGLEQAIEYEKGNLKGVKRHVIRVRPLPIYQADMIKKIRINLELSQSAFANVIGVSKKAVEAWEAGKNIPQGPAQRMIELLDKKPAIAKQYLMKETAVGRVRGRRANSSESIADRQGDHQRLNWDSSQAKRSAQTER